MRIINLTNQINAGLNLLELIQSQALQKELACGSAGIVFKYTHPATGEESTYWLSRSPRYFEQYAPEGLQ